MLENKANPPHDDLYHQLSRALRTARQYVLSSYRSRKDRALFKDVRTFCLFLGHPRSGHSIIGALLDAHPNILMPDEVDVLGYLAAGFSRPQIYHILLTRSQRQALKQRTKGGRDGKTYSYFVPGQWQGRFETIHVAGSSRAGHTTSWLSRKPELLDRLRSRLGGPVVKLILTLRNPFDNISTMMIRGGRSFENAAELYFRNCGIITSIQRQTDPADLLIMRHEDFLARPEEHIRAICSSLGVEASDQYLSQCAAILYRAPSKSRSSIPWGPREIELVQQQISRFDFLKGYSYDS